MIFSEGTKETWNNDILRSNAQPFTQSWEWGAFQEATGRDVLRIKNEFLMAQAITMPLPRGLGYFYLPRGPLFFEKPDETAWQKLRAELKARAGTKLFTRVDPTAALSSGFPVPATQPQHTVVNDLTQDDETLLKEMHHKTRYNIRVAGRKGVTVTEETSEQGLAAFLALTEKTAERHGIQHEPNEYFKKMYEVLAETGMASPDMCSLKLFVARYKDQPVAISLAILFGNTMTYAHGASSDEHKNVMAPFLLHWESMRYARDHGYTRYDFRGVAPEDAGPEHHWAGITRFKEGFGGNREKWPKSFDLPYRFFLYPAYKIGALLKHKKV